MKTHRQPLLRLLIRRSRYALVGLVICLAADCGGSADVSTAVRRTAAQRPDIDGSQAKTGTLLVPTGQPFNIVSFKSGQDGTARGDAKPMGIDGASCRAEGSAGGSAWGEFQLGYCFDNASSAPLKAVVKLRLTAKESHDRRAAAGAAASSPADGSAGADASTTAPASMSPGGAEGPVARTSAASTVLKFFIKDSHGLIIKQENLVATDMEKGPRSFAGQPDLVFDAEFQPERGYYLVVAGRTEVSAGASETAESSLEVTKCALEIAWQTSR